MQVTHQTIYKGDATSLKKEPKVTKNFFDNIKKRAGFFSDGTLNLAYSLVDQHANKNPEKVALLFESAHGDSKSFTYQQIQRESNAFAHGLISLGVNKGDRVFLFLPTIPERYIAFVGILRIGSIVGTLFSAFQEVALLDRLADSGVKVIVTTKDLLPRIESVWNKLPDLKKIIVVDAEYTSSNPNIVSYHSLIATMPTKNILLHMLPTDYAYMLYTSGTTGKPKGVVHAHGDIIHAMATTHYVLDVNENDIYWCTADCGWVTGIVYGILGVWGLGAAAIVYEGRFSPEAWYHILEKYKVTVWYTAPTAIRMLMGSHISPNDYNLSSLRHLASVGEPLNPEAVVWSYEVFGLPFHDTWWQTELGGIAITNYPELAIKPGSMGKPFPGITAAIIDDSGSVLSTNVQGHLAIKPSSLPSLMQTVWNNKKKYESYFSNGWYLSGDQAYQDDDGYFWFIGRSDDVIKTSGERIGPFEVESVLVEHPAIVEAGVIGKPDEMRGEIIKAFIVLKKDIAQTAELLPEIQQFVKKKLAGHAYPREITIVASLPKTRSGKIMRRVLKAQELGLPIGDISTLEDY